MSSGRHVGRHLEYLKVLNDDIFSSLSFLKDTFIVVESIKKKKLKRDEFASFTRFLTPLSY